MTLALDSADVLAKRHTVPKFNSRAMRYYLERLLARNEFVRRNRRTIAIMFVRLSVRLSVWDRRAL